MHGWRPDRRSGRVDTLSVRDGLLLVRRHGQALAALGPTALEDVSSALRLHALAEAVGACALDFAGLIRSLHNCLFERNGPDGPQKA